MKKIWVSYVIVPDLQYLMVNSFQWVAMTDEEDSARKANRPERWGGVFGPLANRLIGEAELHVEEVVAVPERARDISHLLRPEEVANKYAGKPWNQALVCKKVTLDNGRGYYLVPIRKFKD
ncbi:MAG: hypothetical protein Q8O46_03715 [bacterium]|nr:hypothetical protein [bacterium]